MQAILTIAGSILVQTLGTLFCYSLARRTLKNRFTFEQNLVLSFFTWPLTLSVFAYLRGIQAARVFEERSARKKLTPEPLRSGMENGLYD